jgi:hypothetical protein
VALTKLGLYEQIIDEATQGAIAGLNQEHVQVLRRTLDAGDSHSYLVQHLARQINFVLRSLPVDRRLEAQVALSNKIIDLLEAGTPASCKGSRATVTPQGELLFAIVRAQQNRTTRHSPRDKLSNIRDPTRSEPCLETGKEFVMRMAWTFSDRLSSGAASALLKTRSASSPITESQFE